MAETIAAICTPMTKSAIGIIRISGDNAISVAGKVFSPVAKSIDKMQGYTATYGHIFDEKGEFDDGVLTVFRAPHSYTGEDVVEISLHGGSAVMKRALRSVINAGAKMAGGGEFTKRAFMNGKMSLTEAEAVMDIICAENNDALQCAVKVKNGDSVVLSRKKAKVAPGEMESITLKAELLEGAETLSFELEVQ